MKKLLMLAASLGLMALLSGCVQMHLDNVIHEDGSGVATMVMSVSQAVTDAMAEMKDLGMDEDAGQEFPMFDDIKREELEKAAAGHGVEVKTFEKKLVDGRQTLNVVLEFEDLESLSYVMGGLTGEDRGEGFGIFAAEDGNLVLREAFYDFPPEPAAEVEEVAEEAPESASPEEMDPEKMQRQMAVMGTLMGAMGELDISLKITVPGDVISSNAPTLEGRTSIWTVNASNMMSQDQDMTPEIVFSGKGLKIKPIEE